MIAHAYIGDYRVGAFNTEAARVYGPALRERGRPVMVKVKAGDHSGRSNWEAWLEVDPDRLKNS